MRQARALVFLCLAATLASVGTAWAQSPNPQLGGREIRFAADPVEPFLIVTPDRKITGFEPELAAFICDRVRCVAHFTTMPWDDMWPALLRGQYDAIASAVVIVPQLERIVAFSPYMRIGDVLLVRNSETSIRGIDDLRGKTVAVARQSVADQMATRLQGEGRVGAVLRFATNDEAVNAVLTGRADAAIVENLVALRYTGSGPGSPGQLKPVGPLLNPQYMGIATRKEDVALRAAFDAAIASLQRDGTINGLFVRWFVQRRP